MHTESQTSGDQSKGEFELKVTCNPCLKRGSEVRGAGTESFISCFYLYEMYENLNVCTLLFHVFSYFLQFSRNRLAGYE